MSENCRWPGGLLLGLLLCLLAPGAMAQSRVIHEERSAYRNVIVTELNQRRCMRFDERRDSMNQSCMDLRNRQQLVFDYTRMSFAGLLLNPRPQRVLVAGLGGGSIPMVLHAEFPDAQIDVLEVDPAVVRVAKRFFDFSVDERMRVHEVDARVFVRRAALRGEQYDYIVLDAFNGEYIPEHLLTREFLTEVRDLLSPGGVVVANTFAGSRLYDHESVTYQAVFGDFYNFRLPGTGNRIILAGHHPLPEIGDMRAPASALHQAFSVYGVRLMEYPARLTRAPDWNENARILTDQYSPANLLR
jgi:spermidine synthase